jgi:hypothetical protein
MTKGFLKDILRLNKTVFSFNELALLWPQASPKTIKSRIHYYVQQGDVYHIRKGLYAKDNKYDSYELATQIFIPCYISFETVLLSAGVLFQYYSQIFVATYQSKSIECDGHTFVFKRIKNTLLLNTAGVQIKEKYSIATPERAFLDIIYLNNDYHLDNPSALDWKKVYEILPIYNNKRMKKIVDRYYTLVQEESVK